MTDSVKRRRIVFRADGNSSIGYGHFVRLMAIAELIGASFERHYVTTDPSEYQLREMTAAGVKCFPISGNKDLVTQFLDAICPGDIVVIDDYHFPSSAQEIMRDRGCSVVYLDDHNDKHYVCDYLINNIGGFSKESFDCEPYTKLYLGIDYSPIRPAFFDPALQLLEREPGSFLLCFGGSDPYRVTVRMAGMIRKLYPNSLITAIVGDGYTEEDFPGDLKVDLHRRISAAQMARLMAHCDVCIVTASSLFNEAATLGTTLLTGHVADNQLAPYRFFTENHLALGLGDLRLLTEQRLAGAFEALPGKRPGMQENVHRYYRKQQLENIRKIFINAGA